MENSSQTLTLDDNSTLEIGTVEFNGLPFSAGGSFVASDMSHVVGYVSRNKETGHYYLTTWSGDFMYIELKPTGNWKRKTPYSGPIKMFSWRACINGEMYIGRNQGEGLVLTLRKAK